MGIGKVKPQILNLNEKENVEPFSISFAYTGTIQEYIIPYTGLYKLEVWGGNGGNGGGAGGYSLGYKKLKKNTILYIVNGGSGGSCDIGDAGYKQATGCGGGYNGGGQGTAQNWSGCAKTSGGGGGATHIALVTGLLSAIGYTDFVTNGKGLIVAGGGGGRSSYEGGVGGTGGGLSGTAGSNNNSYSNGSGGTQTSGASFGAGGGTARYGGYDDPVPSSGGGGGFYGGNGGFYGSAGGGSGWIGGVPEFTYKGTTYVPSTSNGANGGTGKAKISFITK